MDDDLVESISARLFSPSPRYIIISSSPEPDISDIPQDDSDTASTVGPVLPDTDELTAMPESDEDELEITEDLQRNKRKAEDEAIPTSSLLPALNYLDQCARDSSNKRHRPSGGKQKVSSLDKLLSRNCSFCSMDQDQF